MFPYEMQYYNHSIKILCKRESRLKHKAVTSIDIVSEKIILAYQPHFYKKRWGWAPLDLSLHNYVIFQLQLDLQLNDCTIWGTFKFATFICFLS